MAADASQSAPADESTRIQWMWKSNPDPFSKTEPEEWTNYSDVENDIIEEAYVAKKSQALMDGYCIDFKHRVQIADDDLNRQRPIKRVEGGRNRMRSTLDRFTDHPITPGRPYGGQYGWISPFVIEVRKSLKLQAEQLPSKDASIVPMIVEKAALGIIEEGNLLGRRLVAKNMAKQLTAQIHNGIKMIWKCCAYLYSQEEFLYKKVNEAMRLVGSPEQAEIWRSKVRTLGPFCLLLWDNPFSNKLTKKIKLYRGATLNAEQIKTYEELSTDSNEYRTFQAFTSCSRNRIFAENFGNVLFIMDVFSAFTIDLKEISAYPEEEEELVTPGVSFHVERMEYDSNTRKHLIYLKLRQRFDSKSFEQFQSM
jgi:hypothetical protein